MKRIFDFSTSLILLLLISPILVVIFILVKRDGGPAFFKQERVGLYGKPFYMYKFRSMVVNAPSLGGYSTSINDARITSVGKIIRKTSIDELPQLVNVLFGNMSIVGPRPNVLAQFNEYSQDDWDKRNSVLPGITGLAQATLRSQATYDERLKLDLKYIDTHSFIFDIKIIIKTIKQVISKGGN